MGIVIYWHLKDKDWKGYLEDEGFKEIISRYSEEGLKE